MLIPDRTPDHPDREWLRALLAAGGISQREAARLLHYDERTLRKWCCGERPPTWSACELLRRLVKETKGTREETTPRHHPRRDPAIDPPWPIGAR